MSYRQIRETQLSIWPVVRDSLDHHQRLRDLVRADPGSVSVGQAARARRPWNRVVSEETVWALAKADRLASSTNAAVVEAARAWAAAWDDDEAGPPAVGRDDPADIELYNAVKNLG